MANHHHLWSLSNIYLWLDQYLWLLQSPDIRSRKVCQWLFNYHMQVSEISSLLCCLRPAAAQIAALFPQGKKRKKWFIVETCWVYFCYAKLLFCIARKVVLSVSKRSWYRVRGKGKAFSNMKLSASDLCFSVRCLQIHGI